VVAAVVILLIVFMVLRSSTAKTADTAYFEVRRGDFTVSIVEGGTLEAVNEVGIRNEVEGTSRIIYIVPEGSYVQKDDLLVELDSSQAQDQYNQQQINFEKAQFALIQARQQLEIQKSVVESNIRAAQLKLRFAKMDLDKYLQGESLVELLTASNNISETVEQLTISKDTLRWTEELVKNEFEAKTKLDTDRLAVLRQELQLQIRETNLWMVLNYDRPKKIAEYESAVVEAEKDLERVIQQGERQIAQFEADMITQSNTLVLNERKLERDLKNLENAKIYAPQSGLVVYPITENRFSSESLIEEGATVRNRQELLKLPDTSSMKVTVKVHESHVNMLQPGLPAYVVLDSMPEQRFRAYVEKIGLLPDTQARWGNPNLKVYNTEVHIVDPLPDVKPGVSAKAEIIITNIANVVSVPIQAITTLKGKQVAYALRGGSPTPVPATVGMFNTRFIEVTSGLEPGDRVLLSPPFDTKEKDIEGAVLGEEERLTLTNRPAIERRTNGRPTTSRAPLQTTQTGPPNAAPAVDASSPAPALAAVQGGPASLNPQEMLKQFDKDGDGQLNDEERQAMRAEMQQRFGGQGGPGAGFNREEMVKQFDKDGDGALNDEERQAMRAEMQQRFGGQGGFGGQRGERGAQRERGAPREQPAGNTP
ncbi:MAG: efflux RND transporter periplasmic adaptor subunit, partial [Verrucomicrobia bacterium]|nr:efflux RND transporter periplasmic adaptor subunit [Verrucomicrobiota bacterium]